MERKGIGRLKVNSTKNRQGFMLVDALVAVLIVAIGLVSLAFMYNQGIKSRVGGERRQAAVQIAGQEMERLKQFDGGTYKALKDNVYDDPDNYLTQTGLGPTDYEVKSEIIEEYEPSSSTATQKIESLRVTVSWNDSSQNQIIVESYILVNK